MEREEKIKNIISKVEKYLKFMKEEVKCISGVKISVNLKLYFPRQNYSSRDYIYELYADHVLIMSPRISHKKNLENGTRINSYKVMYSDLTKEDIDKLYKELC